MKGAVAAGHPLTSKAAIDMFVLGGNAFDAVVSAGFASVVTEPTLTSLGGGGFLLAHIENQKKDILFDFFVNTPGLGLSEDIKPVMKPVEIKFPSCKQIFYVGHSSVAVPGMLKGLLHIHNKLCTLPIKTILMPALSYLKDGVIVSEKQEIFLNYLKEILTSSEYGKEIFIKNGSYIKQNNRLYNPLLKEFLDEIANDGTNIYSGEIARKFINEVKENNGIITLEDLDVYSIVEREPLRVKHRDRKILTNPPPSFGGAILSLGLNQLEKRDISNLFHDSEEYQITLIKIMKEMHACKLTNKTVSSQGTTHISVIDEEGNAASMTTSNGSGSGCFFPDTGIMLNNMMGEDDLHPDGFFISPPNKRVSSMMMPTIIMNNGRVEYVLGSGGSKRIRTAILQVLINIIDFGYPLKDAIENHRIHFEEDIVQVEPEMPLNVIKELEKNYNINVWVRRDMYFGGVHAVDNNLNGWGDTRRGGNFSRNVE